MGPQRFPPAKDQATEDDIDPLLFQGEADAPCSFSLPQHTGYGFPQKEQQPAWYASSQRLQLTAGIVSSQMQLEGPAPDYDMHLPQMPLPQMPLQMQLRGPTSHCVPQMQPAGFHQPFERNSTDLHTPPGTPPSPLGASPRKDSPKKKDVREKSPIPYEKVLKPRERVKKDNPLGLRQRELERKERNRASAKRSRVKSQMADAERDAELTELRARVDELESELSLLKSMSSLEIGSKPAIPNLALSAPVTPNLDFETSIAYHRIGANGTFASNDDFNGNYGNQGNLYFYNCTGPFLQAHNVSIAQSGTHAQAFAGGQNRVADGQHPAAVHDPSVLFRKCLRCDARDHASRGTYQRFRTRAQRASKYNDSTAVSRSGQGHSGISNGAITEPVARSQHSRRFILPDYQVATDQGEEVFALAAMYGSVTAPGQDVRDMTDGATDGPPALLEYSEPVGEDFGDMPNNVKSSDLSRTLQGEVLPQEHRRTSH